MSLLPARISPALVLRPGWEEVEAARPQLATTARRYLAQVSLSARPNTFDKTDEVLLGFCSYLVKDHHGVNSFADVGRHEVESYKAYLATRGTPWGTPLKANTLRVHLILVRVFFDRVIEWRWPDAPPFTPVFRTDLPKVPQPLPKALDDASAARFLAAAAADTNKCRQLCAEVLARTGMRVGELCALAKDALSRRSGSWWLRVPVGKLANDRYVPAHPRLVELITTWQAHHDDHGTGLLITHNGRPLDRYQVSRWVGQLAKAAGVGHVHPHQLRHTLATQAEISDVAPTASFDVVRDQGPIRVLGFSAVAATS